MTRGVKRTDHTMDCIASLQKQVMELTRLFTLSREQVERMLVEMATLKKEVANLKREKGQPMTTDETP